MITVIKATHLRRDQPNSSSNVEIPVSNKAIELVKAAKNTRTKKRIPIMFPPAISAKIFGIEMNINEGPACKAFLSPPEKVKTAGIIMSPERIAIPVSKAATW